MIPKIKILFYLLNSKQTAKGTSTIYCRIVMDNLRKQFSTGIDIPSNEWDKLKQKAKGKSIENKTINLHIDQIKNKLTEAETRLMIEKPDNYSIEDIYLIFKGEYEENTPTLLKLFKERLDKMEKLVGSEYTIRTFRKFKEVFKHVKDFLRDSYKISDISFKKLDFKFIQNFQEYLLIQKKHKPITINKIIQRVNQIVLLAVKYKYIQEHPFKGYKPLKEAKQLVFLTEEEVKTLENFQFIQERLERVRDYYLFSVYTGLAYNEAFGLKEEHIIKGFDGQLWIKMIRQKTQREINIPLLPQALKIIQKYHIAEDQEYILPTISNQKMNSYLKEVAEIVGIKKNLTHHTARKTFASTILLYNNVPIEIVSKLLGHGNISVTQKSYAQVINKSVSNHMLQLSKKLEEKE
ncbi:site-specific integrase [Butyricimonas faecihominis]|jgi:site-specific recombinase xerD|uniref:site-specific integrase n=1 Tax=Butyricimonas faecihominis TaxID=1472416 RepID=UPI00266F2B2E|nr:site-specific integrase [Butyricimonas faecihominis]